VAALLPLLLLLLLLLLSQSNTCTRWLPGRCGHQASLACDTGALLRCTKHCLPKLVGCQADVGIKPPGTVTQVRPA
jgi:hypothetical protein